VEATKSHGPSGFIEISGQMLVVDYGKVYLDGSPVGFLHEDGLVSGRAEPLGVWDGLRSIEEVSGCVFRGIDSTGVPLELPGREPGPTGGLSYNKLPMNVIHGRISAPDHHLIGQMDDTGGIYLRDPKDQVLMRKMSEESQLNTVFQGVTSKGKPLVHEFVRPLHRKDRGYIDNEVIRYFEHYDGLNTVQKKYVLETMRIWAASGILQVVRKSEGTAALGNVKHGASGVTGVRTGYVTLDREEFEKEIVLFKRFGPLAVVATRVKPYHEVRINLVVSHEFGHQLEFTLSQACQDRITTIYEEQLKRCDRLHPLPGEYEGLSELVRPEQVHDRIYISGYSRTSMHEYFAEATAAFSVKESRDLLKVHDPGIWEVLRGVVQEPDLTLTPRHVDKILELQCSLRVGGVLADDLLDG
jgi:hypothetical protein